MDVFLVSIDVSCWSQATLAQLWLLLSASHVPHSALHISDASPLHTCLHCKWTQLHETYRSGSRGSDSTRNMPTCTVCKVLLETGNSWSSLSTSKQWGKSFLLMKVLLGGKHLENNSEPCDNFSKGRRHTVFMVRGQCRKTVFWSSSGRMSKELLWSKEEGIFQRHIHWGCCISIL